MSNRRTVRFRVYGIVQGVGFRPTVDRHAAVSGIRGSVCNKGPYVEIIAQGDPGRISCFRTLLQQQPPKRAAILKIDEKTLPDTKEYADFSIVVSEKTDGEIYISPDIAICEDCAQELYDPENRRYLHPFINCTCCGPRLTILDTLPYDRERTSMKMFPMCRTCSEEYHDPASRRYDAQPVCCNDCGPQVYLLPSKGYKTENSGTEDNKNSGTGDFLLRDAFRGREAITAARRAILDGGIVAVKGIGGFHLCCDATNEEAVHSLRVRKRRPAKPFAVMMRDEETVLRECLLNEEQRQILTGHQKPILLLERKAGSRGDSGEYFRTDIGTDPGANAREREAALKADGIDCVSTADRGKSLLAPSVAPGNPKVGVMLPYTPLHMLLFRYDDGLSMPDCLIMTSGNVSGAPICRDDADVLAELSDFCDCILSHDRLIRIRADDTVMDFYRGHPYMIRRSRGYAPLPVMMSEEKLISEKKKAEAGEPPILAIGGELKNTFCLVSGNLFYLSPYVGDLEDLRTVRALEETAARLETLLEVSPVAVVCDLHPKYNSTAVAEEMAAGRGIPLYRIQHHYAHVLSCMAENDRTDRVIGVSFDGTGYGTDGTIWGGEILLADCHGFSRVSAIEPFLQIGGDSAPRQGWRIAASLIWSLCKKRQDDQEQAAEAYFRILDQLSICDERNAKAQRMMAERKIQAVPSTSAGRLFDAVSAMLGICRESTYEGEASIELEFAAERYARREKIYKTGPDAQRNLKTDREKNSAGQQTDRFILKKSHVVQEEDKTIQEGNKTIQEGNKTIQEGNKTIQEGDKTAREEDKTIQQKGGDSEQENKNSPDKTSVFQGYESQDPPLRYMETNRLFASLMEERLRGGDPEKLAYDFHEGLAALIVEACFRISEETGIRTAALTGGCFQNRLLLSLAEEGLKQYGLEVLIHHLVPPNDGGIALGQALAGRFLLHAE